MIGLSALMRLQKIPERNARALTELGENLGPSLHVQGSPLHHC